MKRFDGFRYCNKKRINFRFHFQYQIEKKKNTKAGEKKIQLLSLILNEAEIINGN